LIFPYRPQRKSDGSFNYSPDIYCDKYDENTGICPDGDECVYLHRVSGDVERKYHLRYYKTAQCVHPTDSRGQCVKNGAHCAFAHSSADLRQPQFDQHEAGFSTTVDGDGRDRTSFVIEDPLWHSEFAPPCFLQFFVLLLHLLSFCSRFSTSKGLSEILHLSAACRQV
uniref:Putative unkempt protein (inferred by orthology to a S. mansoni protein) n=1 Tax=Nippostrongylus brasiliensis TaxID=27835 RepID=A0A0N4XPQ7_NIPBR